jgi:hypothetical protein
MTKTKRNELVEVRVMAEQRWAYERRMERLSYRAMRSLVIEAPPAGLGYDLSEHQLKALVTGYRERMAGLEVETLEEHRERELADLDEQHRALVALLDPVDRVASAKVAAGLGFASVEELARAEPALLVLRDDKVRIAALSSLRAVGESRRKLLGLDAPTQLKAEVTVRDAVTEELNEMLARAGRKPITEEKTR